MKQVSIQRPEFRFYSQRTSFGLLPQRRMRADVGAPRVDWPSASTFGCQEISLWSLKVPLGSVSALWTEGREPRMVLVRLHCSAPSDGWVVKRRRGGNAPGGAAGKEGGRRRRGGVSCCQTTVSLWQKLWRRHFRVDQMLIDLENEDC